MVTISSIIFLPLNVFSINQTHNLENRNPLSSNTVENNNSFHVNDHVVFKKGSSIKLNSSNLHLTSQYFTANFREN